MRTNKLFNLINSLSKTEKVKIKEQFNYVDEKQQYKKLFDLLTECDINSLTKDIIFAKLYDFPYTTDKDYLLRNAYRNLVKKIEDFLIEEAFKKDIHNNLNIHNYYLLRSYKNLRLHHLFEVNADDFTEKALADGDYLTASSITSLQVSNYVHHLSPTTKNFEKAGNLLTLQMAYLSAYYLNNQYKVEIEQQKIANAISSTTTKKSVETIDKNQQLYEDYLQLKYKIFTDVTDANISQVKECLSILEKLPKTFIDVASEMQFCQLTLAHEYTVTEDYENANKIYENLLNESIDDKLKASLIFDYVSNFIRQERFDEALQKVNKFENDIYKQTPALQHKINFIKLMLLAFLKDDELLHKHIPICNGLIDYEKYWCRFLYSITAYLRGDFEDAHRECINLKNSLRYKGPKFDVRDILNFYIRFFNLLKNNTEKDTQQHLHKGLQNLQHDIDTYSENALPEFKEYLPFLWIKREVNLKLNE